MTDILIDHRIRDWVFIPLIFVMFMVSMCKHYFQQYSQYTAQTPQVTQKSQVTELVDKNVTKKAQQLAQFSGILPEQSFKMRRAYLCDRTNGILTKAAQKPAKDPLQSMSAMNPTAMADMLKGNLSGIMSMGIQYQWVSYFFSGFILGKVPFPLTQKFRGMLQRGVEIQNLNVRYVSSLSLYFLVLFGAHKLLTLIIGQDEDDDLQIQDDYAMTMGMNQQMMMPMQMPGQQQNPGKVFLVQRENLEGVKHKFKLNNYHEKAQKLLQIRLSQQ